jgi:hypothetical protein
MKKTIIALMALAGVASADTINPLSDAEGWSYSTGRTGRGNWTLTEGALTLTNCNWGQSSAAYDFAESMTGNWDLNATVDRYDGNAMFSLTLVGNTQAITIGTMEYNSGTAFYGTTGTLDARAYSFKDKWDGGGTTVSGTSLVDGAFNTNKTASIFASTVLDAEENVVLTLTIGGTAVETAGVATINLGKDFALEGIVICGDGANSTRNWNVTSLTVIPEPATAALSLLALAGLAARRRRR